MTVFNVENDEWKTGDYSLLMGQQPALHDSINVKFPEIDRLFKKQISQRWMFDEFNHEQSRLDLASCPKSVYQIMLMNLAYQWEADSVASRAVAPLFAPFVTNSELWAALLENTNMEVTHALTYSEIVRQCVSDPSEVFKMVMENENTIERASTVNRQFDLLAAAGRLYNSEDYKNYYTEQEIYNEVFKGVCALYMLERLQFMASFAATFAIVDQGYFQSIGKAVQKIMLDELDCHAALDWEVLKSELKTERGKQSFNETKGDIQRMLWEVIAQEYDWSDYLFSEGRAIVGLNAPLLKDWIIYNAQEIADNLGLHLPHERIVTNPLPWMSNWISIDKTQNANQEATNNNYLLNVVKDNLDSNEELDY